MKMRRSFYVGLALVGAIVALAAFGPALSSMADPARMDLDARFAAPSRAHPFGLDENGSDVLAQVAGGARVSLAVATIAVACGALAGLAIGSAAGWLGGWVDLALMRATEMAQAFPGFLLALALAAALGPSTVNVAIALCATSWAGYARLVRGEVRRLKARDHVTAAIAIGAGPWRALVVHIWPGLAGTLFAQMTFGMAGAVIAEASLSFLGLGAPPSTPTWGSLLNAGRRALLEAPHLSLFPGLAMLALVLGFNLLGDGMRAFFNPREQPSGTGRRQR